MYITGFATENPQITTKQGVKVIVPKSYPFWEKSPFLGGYEKWSFTVLKGVVVATWGHFKTFQRSQF